MTARARISQFTIITVFLAVLIFSGCSAKNERTEISKPAEGQVLGEASNFSEETVTDPKEEIQIPTETNPASQETETVAKPTTDGSGISAYDDLKNNLKESCNKDGSDNNRKCRKYCGEMKKDDQFKNLRKKYCKDKKKEDKKTSTASQTAEINKNELNFLVGLKEFKIEFVEGESVFDVTKRAKDQGEIDFKYDDYGSMGVLITEINGVKNGSAADWAQNKYWILYVNGKTSSVGASIYKLNKSDTSIEWKYEKYS